MEKVLFHSSIRIYGTWANETPVRDTTKNTKQMKHESMLGLFSAGVYNLMKVKNIRKPQLVIMHPALRASQNANRAITRLVEGGS